MAATTVANILTQVRAQLVEPVARFWSDPELASILDNGKTDLWGAILDLHQDHYFKVATDPGLVLRANQMEISGVPQDCFRVQLIEPADTTITSSTRAISFVPKKYKEADFAVARTQAPFAAFSSPARQVYYQLTGVGSPIGPPKILTAPTFTTDIPVRLVYNPSLPTITKDSDNLYVPGGADNALKAWTIAYARAKENDTREPDPGWLGVYATEKQNLLVRLTPREEQEPDVVEDLFLGWGLGM
jgi:hypothetical protein